MTAFEKAVNAIIPLITTYRIYIYIINVSNGHTSTSC